MTRRTGDWRKVSYAPKPSRKGNQLGKPNPAKSPAKTPAKKKERPMPSGWMRLGETIAREFSFADFAGSMKFVGRVAALAEKAAHHPDITIRWNRVGLRMTTHSEKRLTGKDFSLAAKINALKT